MKIPWRRGWEPIPVFLPGEPYGQRSLAGYSPSGHTESDTTKHSIDIERDYYIELGHEIVKDDKSFAEWSERLDT